jgi:ketosteroid isomerase-like protein
MKTSVEAMHQILGHYFEAWQQQDSGKLISLFNKDGIYKVKPFGLEEYAGTDDIREYWETHPVARQINPQPKLLNSAFGEDICFAEWINTFTNHAGVSKTTCGMLLLEFKDGLIQELREHYLSAESV